MLLAVAPNWPGHRHGVPVRLDAVSRLPAGLAVPGDNIREAGPAATRHQPGGRQQQLLGE